MKLKDLISQPEHKKNDKLDAEYRQLRRLLEELGKRELTPEVADFINQCIDELNTFRGTEKELKKVLRGEQGKILRKVEKELKLVPRGYYRTTWIAQGMAVFGIPLGVVLGAALDNMAFMGVGLPLGLAIGAAVGSQMDQKAAAEGRQLDLDWR